MATNSTSASCLPNLSRLSLLQTSTHEGFKRGRDDGGSNSTPKQSKPKAESVNIGNVDWLTLFKQVQSKIKPRGSFRVTAPDVTITLPSNEKVNPSQTYTFSLNEVSFLRPPMLEIKTDNQEVECTSVTVVIGNNELSLDSLFYALTDDEASTCSVSPRITYFSGAGDMVLATLRHIAHQMNFHISLEDAAVPRVRGTTPLFLRRRSLTQALAINRGFGYYEARGFLPQSHYEKTYEMYESRPELLPGAMLLLKNVLLLWTFTITTTPISKIQYAIQHFTEVMDRQIDLAHRSTPLQDEYSDHPIVDFFSPDRLKSHSDNGDLTKLVVSTLYWLRNFPNENGKPPSTFISLRDISRMVALDEQMQKDPLNAFTKEDLYIVEMYKSLRNAEDKFELNWQKQTSELIQFMDVMMNEVWKTLVSGCIFCSYYICPTYTVNGRPVFIGVKASQSSLYPPTAEFTPLNENFQVEFK